MSAKLENLSTEVYKRIEKKAGRELARRLFERFVLRIKSHLELEDFHGLLFGYAQAVIDGVGIREMISLPPRHSKSETFSVLLPAMYLGRYPHKQILHVSHSAHLSNEFSRQVREIIRDNPAFRSLFPHTRLHEDKARIDDWKTSKGGGFKSVGVGAGITGTGFDLAILDDIVKEGDEQSEQILQSHQLWFASALRTRAMPDASIVIPMTRWSVSDIIGWLLLLEETGETLEHYDYLRLPALAEPDDILGRPVGAALWPERFPVPDLLQKRALSEHYFQALFQQNPPQSQTQMFRRELVKRQPRYIVPPNYAKRFWCFDLALTEDDESDYSALAHFFFYEAGVLANVPILACSNAHRYRRTWGKMNRLIKRMLQAFPKDDFVFPSHQLELMALQSLRDETAFGARLLRVDLGTRSKVARAQLLQNHHERGGFWLAAGRNNDILLNEIVGFRNGASHDDFTDVATTAAIHCGIGGEFLTALKEERKKRVNPYGFTALPRPSFLP